MLTLRDTKHELRMTAEIEVARRYRDRAQQLRTIADAEWHVETRETLLRIATDYDLMAETVISIDETNRSVRLSRRTA
jgi:hypothetical protein